MNNNELNDTNIQSEQILISPEQLKQKLPLSEKAISHIAESRHTVMQILQKKDPRLLVICGPCSVHDIKAIKEYAQKLKQLADDVQNALYIVMRVYFEKPRTTVGWKGLINDPHMDNSFDIEHGLHIARELLIDLVDLGLPLAFEALDPNTPQYLGDLFSWAAIGARTTESQTHREMASGLSMPVGFKNGTDGNLDTAINAMQSASMPHRFVGINQQGQVALLQTKGNHFGHVILRGGKTPNYDAKSVLECETHMQNAHLTPLIMVDCSHGNSCKDYRKQALVLHSVIEQIESANRSIIGVMIESHLNEGAQSLILPPEKMRYGVSITDACISWEETDALLHETATRLARVLPKRVSS